MTKKILPVSDPSGMKLLQTSSIDYSGAPSVEPNSPLFSLPNPPDVAVYVGRSSGPRLEAVDRVNDRPDGHDMNKPFYTPTDDSRRSPPAAVVFRSCENGQEVWRDLKISSLKQYTILSYIPDDEKYRSSDETPSSSKYVGRTQGKEYRLKAREQLCTVRPEVQPQPNIIGFRDKFGYVVDFTNGKPDTLGEASYQTAIAIIALANGSYAVDDWNKANCDSAIISFLDVLLTKSWGNTTNGIAEPIRHPEQYDYDASGKQIRQRPMTKDSFGPIIAAAFYAYRSTKNDIVREKAQQLILRWEKYLFTVKWTTHSNILAGEYEAIFRGNDQFHKNIYGPDGTNAKYLGPGAFALLPHELFAFQKVSTTVLTAPKTVDAWINLTEELRQTIFDLAATYIGTFASRSMELILEKLVYKKSYSVNLGPKDWGLGAVKGDFSIGIDQKTRTEICNNLRSFIVSTVQNSIRLSSPATPVQLLDLAVDEIVRYFPKILSSQKWIEILKNLIGQAIPIFSGNSLLEICTFLATMESMRKLGPDTISYAAWHFGIEFEFNYFATILRPAVFEFYSHIKAHNNPNGFWAWLAVDDQMVEEQLVTFETADLNEWYQFAYSASDYNAWKVKSRNINPSDISKSSSRVDYLSLFGLTQKIPSNRYADITIDLKLFFKEVTSGFEDFQKQISAKFLADGAYSQEYLNSAGDYVREKWTAALQFSQNVFHVKVRVQELTSAFGGLTSQYNWSPEGVFVSRQVWSKVLPDGAIDPLDLILKEVRDSISKAFSSTTFERGFVQTVDLFATSTVNGIPLDRLEWRVRFQGNLLIRGFFKSGAYTGDVVYSKCTKLGRWEDIDKISSRYTTESNQLIQATWENLALKVESTFSKFTGNGAIRLNDKIIEKVRDNLNPLGPLTRTKYLNNIVTEVSAWAKSTALGEALQDDNVSVAIRSLTGELAVSFFEKSVFKEAHFYWKSNENAMAEAINQIGIKIRSSLGRVTQTMSFSDKSFRQYFEWVDVPTSGISLDENLLMARDRDLNGVLMEWTYLPKGAFKQKREWFKSTRNGDVIESELRRSLSVLDNGDQLIEVWDEARNKTETLKNKLGQVIRGPDIDLPSWPPKLPPLPW